MIVNQQHASVLSLVPLPPAPCDLCLDKHNQNPKPFKWAKFADEILVAFKRFCFRNVWPLAMLGFSTVVWKLALRDRFIGWTPAIREKNLPWRSTTRHCRSRHRQAARAKAGECYDAFVTILGRRLAKGPKLRQEISENIAGDQEAP